MSVKTETARVSSRTLSSCFPLKAFSHFSFNADVSSVMILDQSSRLKSFIPGFEVARPDRLINMLPHHRPQSLKAWRYLISIQFLIVGTLQFVLVQTFLDVFQRYHFVPQKIWSHLVSKS